MLVYKMVTHTAKLPYTNDPRGRVNKLFKKFESYWLYLSNVEVVKRKNAKIGPDFWNAFVTEQPFDINLGQRVKFWRF